MAPRDYLDVWVILTHESRTELLRLAISQGGIDPSPDLVADLRTAAGLRLDATPGPGPTLIGDGPQLSADFMGWVRSVAHVTSGGHLPNTRTRR